MMGTAEKLNEIKNGLDALEMMADAYILGPEAYESADAAEALHYVLMTMRERLAEVQADIRKTA